MWPVFVILQRTVPWLCIIVTFFSVSVTVEDVKILFLPLSYIINCYKSTITFHDQKKNPRVFLSSYYYRHTGATRGFISFGFLINHRRSHSFTIGGLKLNHYPDF